MFPDHLHAAASAHSSFGSFLSQFQTWVLALGHEVNPEALAKYVIPAYLMGGWVAVVTALVTHAGEIFPNSNIATIQALLKTLPAPSFA